MDIYVYIDGNIDIPVVSTNLDLETYAKLCELVKKTG